MRKIKIDEEFMSLLPTLDTETYERLEDNIRKYGCREAIVLWNDVIIDGHNKYEICTKHKIPYRTVRMEFDCREEALIWIITTQVSRRHLTPTQMSYYRGLHYRMVKQLAGLPAGKSEKCQNDPFHGTTINHLAEHYRVSKNTIERDARLSESIDAVSAASPETKRQILSREGIIHKNILGGYI